VESTSEVNSNVAESESVSFNSESASVEQSASNSHSIVESTSESNSASASKSNSTVLSESNSASTAISESLSAYKSTSASYEISDITNGAGSALSTYDSVLSSLSVLNSDSTSGEALEEARKSVAESIIAYKIINGGSSLTDIVWNDAGYYTVYYKDAIGRELSEAYQYSVDENGNVSVNKVDIKYEATGGTNGTITNKHDQKPADIDTTGAPTTKYEIINNADGTTDEVITINGTEYRNPNRQINPDGTISYIIKDTPGERELFVVKADGSEGYYTKYNKNDNKRLQINF